MYDIIFDSVFKDNEPGGAVLFKMERSFMKKDLA
jgi:hypothetical protein